MNNYVRSAVGVLARFRRRSAAILLAVVLAGAAGALAARGSAEAATQGAVWPAGVARPAAASCPRGETLIEPTSGRTDALGVSRLSYKSAPGMVTILPPRGLKAGALTPALLADLGTRASALSGAGRQSIVREVLAESARPVAPAFCESHPKPDLAGLSRKTVRASGPGQVGGHIWRPTGAAPESRRQRPAPLSMARPVLSPSALTIRKATPGLS